MALRWLIQRSKPGLALALIVLCFHASAQTTPYLEFSGGQVHVKKIDGEVLYTFKRYHNEQADWSNVFPVRTSNSDINVAGTYHTSDSTITFNPSFPFARGVEYVAAFFAEQLAKNPNEVYLPAMRSETLTLHFRIDDYDSPAPEVVAIYPSASVLPENLLRFHLVFSTPMTRGDAYRFVKLMNEEGKEVEKAFLVVDEEMWDNDMKSLTLLLDPGRIKRGLKANLEMKAPLESGKRYTLEIAPGWKNASGKTFHSPVRKQFTCTAADRTIPDITQWKIVPPPSERASLFVDVKEPMDAVMLENAVIIEDANGNRVAGVTKISAQESVIEFSPLREWTNQTFRIRVNPKLEDLAGNNLNRPFDKDLTQPQSKPGPATLSFAFSRQAK